MHLQSKCAHSLPAHSPSFHAASIALNTLSLATTTFILTFSRIASLSPPSSLPHPHPARHFKSELGTLRTPEFQPLLMLEIVRNGRLPAGIACGLQLTPRTSQSSCCHGLPTPATGRLVARYASSVLDMRRILLVG